MGELLSFKPGVKLIGLQPEMALAGLVIYTVMAKYGPVVITSVMDGVHMKGSLHYEGKALDLRTNHMQADQIAAAVEDLKKQLGSEFDVILESDHIHAEFQPKA